MEKHKDNLFVLSKRYNELIKEARSLIPDNSVIINTLYKEVYEKDLLKCLDNHFGESNDVKIYIVENYEGSLELFFIVNGKYDNLFMSNLYIAIESILEKYEDIDLFYYSIESFNYRVTDNLPTTGVKIYKMK